MEVYIYQGSKRNIGDDFNFWFWDEIMGQAVSNKDDSLLVGIGTILDERIPENRNVHVLGSGTGYGKIANFSHWNIHFLRGHLTAKALSCDDSCVISDPAILISNLRPQNMNKKHKISFMPHVGIDSKKYKNFINNLGWNYISPSDEESVILSDIAASERLITSAMHGAIIADSYRTPWLPVSTSHEILLFKWKDWFSSLGLDIDLISIPTMWPNKNEQFNGKIKHFLKSNLLEIKLKNLERNGRFFLSDSNILISKQKQIMDKVDNVQKEILSREVCL